MEYNFMDNIDMFEFARYVLNDFLLVQNAKTPKQCNEYLYEYEDLTDLLESS